MIITDLCVFEVVPAVGLVLKELHPGVTLERRARQDRLRFPGRAVAVGRRRTGRDLWRAAGSCI